MAVPDPDALFNELEARFTELTGQYDNLDQEADASITYWRYAKDSAFELRADYFRRFNEKPGQLLETEPTTAYLYHAYGYDTEDRIIYSALFQTEDVPRVCTFYVYAEDRIAFATFNVQLYTERYDLHAVGQLMQPVGHPQSYIEYSGSVGHARLIFEEYHYDAVGRLAKIEVLYQEKNPPFLNKTQDRIEYTSDQEREVRVEETYEYDGHVLKQIVERSTSSARLPGLEPHVSQRITYEAPNPNETDQALFEAARTSLTTALIDGLSGIDPAKRLQTPSYNLVLSYDAVADSGVWIVLGSELQRQDWERDRQEYDEYSYRSLIMHQSALQYRDSMLDIHLEPADYERFIRESRREKRWKTIRDLMNRVARDLNHQEWSGILNVTEDFIVFASDYEALEDTHDEIAACVPEEKLQLLRDQGLVDDV